MIKKILNVFSVFLPVFLTISCSAITGTKNLPNNRIVKLSYDFSYQTIDKQELEEQFSSFKQNTLFEIALKNFYYNKPKQIVKKRGYLNSEQIIWPGQKEKINIETWVWKMFCLTPLGTKQNDKGGN